jgi:hypothetical protein
LQVNYKPANIRFSRPAQKMNRQYESKDIEVLEGLEPVKRRPGMYTDTTRPNHLAMEVIENSVDEALAGHARVIAVHGKPRFRELVAQVEADMARQREQAVTMLDGGP